MQAPLSFLVSLNSSTRNYINYLLKQLTVDYRNTKQERKEISALASDSDEEFTLVEEIELLTSDIRGYAS